MRKTEKRLAPRNLLRDFTSCPWSSLPVQLQLKYIGYSNIVFILTLFSLLLRTKFISSCLPLIPQLNGKSSWPWWITNVIYTNTEASQSRLIFPLKWSLHSLSAFHHTFLVPRAAPYLGPSLPITVHRFLFLIHSYEHVNSLLNKSQIVYSPPVVTINYRSWYSRPSQIWAPYGVFFPWSPWLYNGISLPCFIFFLVLVTTW